MTVSLTWPSQIRLMTVEGYQIKPKPNVVRTDMEVGPARQRRRSTMTTDDMPVVFKMTNWELALFEAWYADKALEGAAWFVIPHLGGVGLVNCEARFKAGQDFVYARLNGERTQVTCTLEVRQRPRLKGADFDLLVDSDPEVLFAAIADLQTALHVTLP